MDLSIRWSGRDRVLEESGTILLPILLQDYVHGQSPSRHDEPNQKNGGTNHNDLEETPVHPMLILGCLWRKDYDVTEEDNTKQADFI